MITGGALAAAMAGLRGQLEHFERTAQRIVSDTALERFPENWVDLRLGRHAVAASVETVRAAGERIGTLLDVLR